MEVVMASKDGSEGFVEETSISIDAHGCFLCTRVNCIYHCMGANWG